MKVTLIRYNDRFGCTFKVGDVKTDKDKELISDFVCYITDSMCCPISLSIEQMEEIIDNYKKSEVIGIVPTYRQDGRGTELIIVKYTKNKEKQPI